MSYQVLARKWRPQNFSQVVGQQHVLTAISNGLAENKVHHAYLFSGTRGVGKTSIARLLAKSLNCEQGVTATPCGECSHCVAIDQGRFVDLLEIDAASRTKVDDTRELLDNVQYKPAVGRYKVYLIDEVHMLSKHSFNALLKTLEEPPEYVKFLLATTDPQKLPITVLSRCLQFHLKAILPEQIEAQLAFILQQEKATFEHTALNVIAKAADGSMRDALSLTDQALAFGAGNIEYQAVLKMLGTLDTSHLEYLLHFIASGNVEKVFQKIEEFVALGADFAQLHQELASLCHQIALQQLQPANNSGEKSAIQLISERLSPEEVQLYYQIAIQGFRDYSIAPNGKVALEMTVMRLLAFKPANYVELAEGEMVNNPVVSALPSKAVNTPVSEPAPVQTAQTIPSAAPSSNHQAPVAAPIAAVPAASSETDIQVPAPAMPTPSAPLTATVAAEPTPVIDNEIKHNDDALNEALEQPLSAPIETQPTGTSPEPIAPITETNIAASADTTDAPTQAQVTPPVVEPQQAVQQVTHSRNMLRSHRLKRNETKKRQATTDPQRNEPVVAAPVTPTPFVTAPPVQQAPAPVAAPRPNSVSNAPAAMPAASPKTAQGSDHLPPLDQYQDSEFESNNFSNNYASQFDDAGFEPYIPPEMQQAAPMQPVESAQVSSRPASIQPVETPAPQPVAQAEALRVSPSHVAAPTEHHVTQAETPRAPSSSSGAFGTHPFFSDLPFVAPEIDTALYVQDKLTDPWSIAIKKMGVVGLVKLLAKNTVMKKVDNQIVLTLKTAQQHLLNNGSLCEELQTQLKNFYGEQYSMYIEVGDVAGQLTAFEAESALYEQYLNNAKRAIVEDENIKQLVANCGAKVYENSVIPL